jgi:hypothetical protein
MHPVRLARSLLHRMVRQLASPLPRSRRQRIARALVRCEPFAPGRLELKLAVTDAELEDCFRLLHDAYVEAGFMVRDPSGLRVTPYHALPATAILCAKVDGRIAGTVSVIGDNPFGLPLQRIIDLSSVRSRRGEIAEVSGLAIHPDFRCSGGGVLFALMKLVYEYCTRLLGARHLVIAVHPRHFEMFEALLCFRRLSGRVVPRYAFANGEPAMGGTLDLHHAPELLRKHYAGSGIAGNLHRFLCETPMPGLNLPTMRQPPLTPAQVEEFCNRRAGTFAGLSPRRRALLRLVLNTPGYAAVLPDAGEAVVLRRHRRFAVRRDGRLFLPGGGERVGLQVVEVSRHGFRARVAASVPPAVWLTALVQLGAEQVSRLQVIAAQDSVMDGSHLCGFHIGEPDLAWRKFINALYDGQGHPAAETDSLAPHAF